MLSFSVAVFTGCRFYLLPFFPLPFLPFTAGVFVGGQTANMAKKGVTASGCGTEYTWQVRTVSYRAYSGSK